MKAEFAALNDFIDTSARSIQEFKVHLWENRRDMDFAEKADYRTSVNLSVCIMSVRF